MTKGAPRGAKGRHHCSEMRRGGILCNFVVFFQQNHTKMSKLLSTEMPFYNHSGFESPQTKKHAKRFGISTTHSQLFLRPGDPYKPIYSQICLGA